MSDESEILFQKQVTGAINRRRTKLARAMQRVADLERELAASRHGQMRTRIAELEAQLIEQSHTVELLRASRDALQERLRHLLEAVEMVLREHCA